MEKPKECPFCSAVSSSIQIAEFWNGLKPGGLIEPEQYNMELSVALISRKWKPGTPKGSGGRMVDYKYRGCGYKLTFCPTCGKRLRKTAVKV